MTWNWNAGVEEEEQGRGASSLQIVPVLKNCVLPRCLNSGSPDLCQRPTFLKLWKLKLKQRLTKKSEADHPAAADVQSRALPGRQIVVLSSPTQPDFDVGWVSEQGGSRGTRTLSCFHWGNSAHWFSINCLAKYAGAGFLYFCVVFFLSYILPKIYDTNYDKCAV